MSTRPRGVVVVGASAGGVEALQAMVGGLPAGLAASVLVVLHMPSDAESALPAILGRHGTLPARTARHGDRLEDGWVYTAVPGHHLLVVGDAMNLSRTPGEHGHRPSIDVLLRSAAVAYGSAATGVLLSGMLADGVDGLATIAGVGGRTIVQDPSDALFSDLPRRALQALTPDHVVRAADIGAVLATDQTQQPTKTTRPSF